MAGGNFRSGIHKKTREIMLVLGTFIHSCLWCGVFREGVGEFYLPEKGSCGIMLTVIDRAPVWGMCQWVFRPLTSQTPEGALGGVYDEISCYHSG